MSAYINPKLRPQFDSLSPGLQQEVLSKGVSIHTLYDLIHVLEDLVAEAEGQS